jgi:hypothetical protein
MATVKPRNGDLNRFRAIGSERHLLTDDLAGANLAAIVRDRGRIEYEAERGGDPAALISLQIRSIRSRRLFPVARPIEVRC